MENTTDIQNLLTEGEHMSLECKTATKSVPSSVWDTYSAFANTNGGMIRNDDTLLHKAVREAVTNMIIHSDFMVNGLLRIEKYDDRIVLTNPGLLKLPLEQIYSGGESKARNQRMQNMLRMIGFGENLGSGFPLILHAWDEKHWTKPELIEQPELLQVKLVLQLDMGSVPTSSQLRPNFVPSQGFNNSVGYSIPFFRRNHGFIGWNE